MNPCAPWLLVAVLAVAACAPDASDADADADADRSGAPSRAGRADGSVAWAEHRRTAAAASLLRAWDRRRARVWARGDAAALAALYTPGSRTGRHDRAMLAAYADRGLRVTGLRTQVLAVSLRSWHPGRVRLEVTDRLVGARAVRRGVRIRLPSDRPSSRVVSLRRVAGSWRVVEVREHGTEGAARVNGAVPPR